MTIVSRGNKGGYTTARFTATGHIQLNSADSAVAANSAGETVNEAAISTVFWSLSSGQTWTVARGANTVLILSGSGSFNYQQSAMPLEQNVFERQANVAITKSGGNGSLVIKIHKKSDFDNPQY